MYVSISHDQWQHDETVCTETHRHIHKRANRYENIYLLSRKPAISLKRGKIGPRSLLTTNRKSHTHFRMVPKSTTLGDLEGQLRTVSKHVRLSEPTTKIWMKIDPYYQRRRCSPMTLDSDNIRFMRIFAGVPWRGGVKQQWGNGKRGFSGFRMLRLRHLSKRGHH